MKKGTKSTETNFMDQALKLKTCELLISTLELIQVQLAKQKQQSTP